MSHFSILGIITIFLKVLILDPQIPILLHFGLNKKFSEKRTPSQFCVYQCKLCVKMHAKNQKKLMSQSQENNGKERQMDRWTKKVDS